MTCAYIGTYLICKLLTLQVNHFCGNTTNPRFCINYTSNCVRARFYTRNPGIDDAERAHFAMMVCNTKVMKQDEMF